MHLSLDSGLAYVTATLRFGTEHLTLDRVLLDTGSAGTVFAADLVRPVGIKPEGNDRIRRILGVGGSEYVFSKQLDELTVGEMNVENFEIQVGAMRYGFPLDGILGMDFLLRTQAIIDLRELRIRR